MTSTLQLDLPLHGIPLLTAASTAILFFSVLVSMVLLFRFHPTRSSTRKRNLPPSPPKLPIIGNLHQLGPLPHQSLRALARDHGPLLLLQLGQVPTLVVSSAEGAKEVLKVHDLAFASRPRSGAAAVLSRGKGIGSAPYGEYWRQAKKISIVHLLSSHRVRAFRAKREEHVARLVGKISELSSSGHAVDMSRVLSSFTNSLVCRATVGGSAMEEGTTRDMTELIAQTSAVIGGFEVMSFFPSLAWLGKLTRVDAKVLEVAGRWRSLLRRMAVCERAQTAKDGSGFLDALLSLQRDATRAAGFTLSRDEIYVILQGMIGAGSDTSYLVLERALEELVKHPTAMSKAQEEVRGAIQGKPTVAEDDVSRMGYLKAVIKETLRLHPPAPLLLPRESMKAAQIQGFDVPAETKVLINAWAIARSPDYWESPDDFQPERFLDNSREFTGNDFQFIPFGAGRRICPGIQFAMATMELALANLLYHFNWTPMTGIDAQNFRMDEAPGLTIHRRKPLLLVVSPNALQGA